MYILSLFLFHFCFFFTSILFHFYFHFTFYFYFTFYLYFTFVFFHFYFIYLFNFFTFLFHFLCLFHFLSLFHLFCFTFISLLFYFTFLFLLHFFSFPPLKYWRPSGSCGYTSDQYRIIYYIYIQYIIVYGTLNSPYSRILNPTIKEHIMMILMSMVTSFTSMFKKRT